MIQLTDEEKKMVFRVIREVSKNLKSCNDGNWKEYQGIIQLCGNEQNHLQSAYEKLQDEQRQINQGAS